MSLHCIALRAIDQVAINSVGIVEQSNGTARVLFVGAGCVKEVPTHYIKRINVAETGDNHDFKICNICHELKPVTAFSKNQGNKKTTVIRRPSCSGCRKDIDGVPLTAWGRRSLDNEKPASDEMFKCPICGKRCIPWVTANLVRDHDHTTGNPRMWICDSCNTGLGRFKDNKKLLEDAIAYLAMFDDDGHSSI